MFWTSNNRGSALFYIVIFTAILGMLTYHMQSYMTEQATRAESKSHDHIRKMFGKEMYVIMSSADLCSSQVVVTGDDRFEIRSLHRAGNRYLDKYLIKSMQIENKKELGFGFLSANFVVTIGIAGSDDPSTETKVSRTVGYGFVNEQFSCQSSPDKNKECAKIGAKMIEGRCTICETLGGIWQQGECRI